MKLSSPSCAFFACVAASALLQPAWAGNTYQFAGAVTSMPAVLAGGGIAVGDTVRFSVTLGPVLVDTDAAPSVGSWSGAIASWTMRVGPFVTTGIGGDVVVCDSPVPAQVNCGSAVNSPWWNGTWLGKDGLRFVPTMLSSAPMVLNGYLQNCWNAVARCGSGNVYADSVAALAGTGIPPVLDPAVFGSATNNGRLEFGPGPVWFSLAVVPEPGTYALMASGLGLLALAAGRRRALNSSTTAPPSASRCAGA